MEDIKVNFTTYSTIFDDLVRVLEAYENKNNVFSNQGQSLDGYSALANFVSVAERARSLRTKCQESLGGRH